MTGIMTQRVARILILAAGLTSGSANAAQFEFKVPFELKNLNPTIRVVKFQCVVYDDAMRELGRNHVNYAMQIQASGTMTIPVDVAQGKSALNARSYICEAIYCPTVADTGCFAARGEVQPEHKHQPGTEFTPYVKGAIPQSP